MKKLFELMGSRWQSKRKWVNYVDLGSGDCKGTQVFADFIGKSSGMVVKVTAVDASNKCEDLCKEKGVDFLSLELGSDVLPLKDCQVFTLFETIEHVFETDRLLKSIRNSISTDGLLLATTLNVVCWKNRIMVPLGIQPFNTEVSTRKLSYGYRFESLKKRWLLGSLQGIFALSLYILFAKCWKIMGSQLLGLTGWRIGELSNFLNQ
jgi:SAM-dependent methyltransferase